MFVGYKIVECFVLSFELEKKNITPCLFHQIQAGFCDQPGGTLLETTVGIVLTLISSG